MSDGVVVLLKIVAVLVAIIVGVPRYTCVSGPFWYYGHWFDGQTAFETGKADFGAFIATGPSPDQVTEHFRKARFGCSTRPTPKWMSDKDKVASQLFCNYDYGPLFGLGSNWYISLDYGYDGKIVKARTGQNCGMCP